MGIFDFLYTALINRPERRLRALWRLLAQAMIYFGGTLLLTLAGGIAVGIYLVASGANLQDADLLNSILNHPLAQVFSALVSLAMILTSCFVAARWIDRRPFRDFGFHFNAGWWADFGFGLFLGALLMTAIFLVELGAGWIQVTGFFQSLRVDTSFAGGMLAALVTYFCVGITEELLARGYELRNLAEGLNLKFLSPRAAVLLAYLGSSTFFGLLHLGNPHATLTSVAYLVGAGLLLGLGYVLTGDLGISIGLHMTWNFFEGAVFSFPVSGLASSAAVIAVQSSGPLVWTGGDFGPEGGLLHPAAVILGCLLILAWVRWRRGRVKLAESLADYTPLPAAEPPPAPPTEPI